VYSEASIQVVRRFALATLAIVLADLGRLLKAREFARAAAQDLAAAGDVLRLRHTVLSRTAAAAVSVAQGQFDEARRELEPVVESGRQQAGLNPWTGFVPTLLLAQARLELGDRAGAAELADEARDVLAAWPDGTEALRARLARLDARIAGPLGAAVAGEARSRSARSASNCTSQRTRSRPTNGRSTANSASHPGAMPLRWPNGWESKAFRPVHPGESPGR
jgi:hypothetical protein